MTTAQKFQAFLTSPDEQKWIEYLSLTGQYDSQINAATAYNKDLFRLRDNAQRNELKYRDRLYKFVGNSLETQQLITEQHDLHYNVHYTN